MAASQQNITARQLSRAREAQFHRNGEPLQTTEAIREWVESAGLLPVYPLTQFQAPMPSFAEAVLGRTENNWVAPSKRAAGDERAEAFDNNSELEDEDLGEDEDSEEDFDEGDADEDEEFDDAEEEGDEDSEEDGSDEDSDFEGDEEDEDGEEADDADDELEPPTAEGDEAKLSGDGNIPSDPETMLSDDDEFAEDEGDEVAEEDRIHADGDPTPNDLREGSTSTEAAEEEPATPPVNGFSPEERETVYRALARLVEDGSVVPLNLLGNATGEPDYIVPASAFSFVYTLRGDKNWKNEPATIGPMRVSPLAVKVFSFLKEKGAMAPHKLTSLLGRGITDSATLRALNELWSIQRVIPLPNADGEPAKWELITNKFLRQLKSGANAGQPTALSALLSLYLHQTIAATGDDMEIFLSPLAARSRVREVVHGLSATRQLDEIVVEGKTLLHIAGELPALPADDSAPVASMPQRSRYEQDDRRADMQDRRERFGDRGDSRPPRRSFGGGDDRRPAPRSFGDRGDNRGGRPSFSRGDRPSFGDRPRKPFGDRPSFGDRKPFGERQASGEGSGERERRPFQRREGAGDRGGFAPRENRGFQPRERNNFAPRGDREGFQPRERNNFARPWDDERPRRTEGDGERRPFTPREGGERRPFTPREGGERRPYTPRGDRGGFAPREDRGERRPYTPRGDRDNGFAPRRPFTPSGDRDNGFAPRRPFTPREGGERRPFVPREGGERRPFTPREGGERRPFTPREGGERRPFTPREGGERRPFTPREGGRPSFGGSRPAFGSRPRFDREGGGGGDRREGGFGDRKRFSGEPGEGRPSFKSGSHSAGPGGAKFGGSGFGRDRGKGAPGKFGKPGFKPSFRGPGTGPARGGAPKRRPE